MSFPEDNPAMQAADVHNVAETGSSFLDDTGDFLTKGVPLAVGSGLVSMANTAIALGNTLGGDFEKIDYDQKVKEYDDDLSQYYQEHKEGIDLGGFVATSFIPGLGGLKALKLVQGGILGKNAAFATGLFRSAEERYLGKALSSVQQETNAVFRQLDGNKLAAIAAGFGEQTLQAASFETAVMLTMNQNPTINKEDSSYFKSLIVNTPEIISSSLIGGAIGGGINAFGIGGKIKSAIRARDKEDFPSLNIKELGLSDVDPGTAAAIDYMWLRGRARNFEELKKTEAINDRQIANFEKTQQQKATELLTRIRQDIAGNDAELAKSIWNHLNKLPEDGAGSAEDIGISLLGAATKAERITEADASQLGFKILHDGSYLSERHAKNIMAHGKITPEVIDPTNEVALEEARLAGYEIYKDTAGNLRTVPGLKYKGQLNTAKDTTKHDMIIKLSGDREGAITESAYPVLGDFGNVKLDKGNLYVGDQVRVVPSYDPLNNSPLDSNAAFVKEKLLARKGVASETDELADDVGTLGAESNNLPRIEAAVVNGDDLIIHDLDEMATPEILKSLKLNARQDLVNAGKDFGYIARALNVSQEFAETGKGEYMISRMEDHTRPVHAKLLYNTNVVPDGNYLRGVGDLTSRIRLAKEHNAKVAAQILGPAYSELPQTQGTMMGVNTIPDLGNTVKSADAAYGTFAELMQYVGKVADREFRTRTSEVLSRISAYHQAILQDENLTRDFNGLVAKIRSSKAPLVMMDDGTLVPQNIMKQFTKESALPPGSDSEAQKMLEKALETKEAFKIESPELASYLRATQDINRERVNQFNAFFAAKGEATSWDPDIIYVPPINTRKYPFVAFVKEKAETNFRPTSVITASDAQSLEAKIRAVNQELGDVVNIYTKSDIANFYKMQGEYESGLLLGNSTVDSSLKKRGILSDFLPRTDGEILQDFINWHTQSEQALVRNAIELNYAQEFAELRAMGASFTEYQQSRFGRDLTDKEFAQIRKDNPYERYIDTALAVSNYAKYDSVWGKINSAVEGLGQSMFKVWDSVFNKANKGEIDWVAANREAEQYGYRPPFKDMLKEIINPVIPDRKIVEPLVAKVNAALATTILRLDPLNSIVNILGTPALIAAELRSISRNIGDPDKVGKLSQLLSVGIPGRQESLPSMMKLISQAMKNFVSDDGTLLAHYQQIGAVQSDLQLYRNVLDAAQLSNDAMKSSEGLINWSNNLVKKAAEMGATLTGNNLSERMVRFVAADIMRQLGETAGVAGPELNAYINTFVNRVHGNYTASQRPHLFQGAVGQAISLFQTYQFNVMQNIIRYVEGGDKTAVAALLGMQNTIFGMQGNPAFYLLNSAIGNANREHKDLVTGAYATLGKDVSDWLLYGLGSNALKVNLYNRGDLTPRYVTVVPTNIQDVPAVSIPAKFLGNLFDTIGNITKGGSLSQSILEGISQSTVNRPLAGLAQLAQGYRTTQQGNLLVAYNEMDTTLAAAKIFGGEELNRAIEIDNYYRQVAYKKKDQEKIADLSEAIKNKIRSGEPMTSEDTTTFMQNYSRSGGRVSGFNRFMTEQYKNANKSQIQKMKSSLASPFAKNLALTMGAEDEEMLYLESGGTE